MNPRFYSFKKNSSADFIQEKKLSSVNVMVNQMRETYGKIYVFAKFNKEKYHNYLTDTY